jgi:hypothetical protein
VPRLAERPFARKRKHRRRLTPGLRGAPNYPGRPWSHIRIPSPAQRRLRGIYVHPTGLFRPRAHTMHAILHLSAAECTRGGVERAGRMRVAITTATTTTTFSVSASTRLRWRRGRGRERTPPRPFLGYRRHRIGRAPGRGLGSAPGRGLGSARRARRSRFAHEPGELQSRDTQQPRHGANPHLSSVIYCCMPTSAHQPAVAGDSAAASCLRLSETVASHGCRRSSPADGTSRGEHRSRSFRRAERTHAHHGWPERRRRRCSPCPPAAACPSAHRRHHPHAKAGCTVPRRATLCQGGLHPARRAFGPGPRYRTQRRRRLSHTRQDPAVELQTSQKTWERHPSVRSARSTRRVETHRVRQSKPTGRPSTPLRRGAVPPPGL